MKQTPPQKKDHPPFEQGYQPFQYQPNSSVTFTDIPAPENPPILKAMCEISERLTSIEALCGQLRGDILGPEVRAMTGNNGDEKEPPGLHAMILSANTRLACLAGELRTINARVGCKEL